MLSPKSSMANSYMTNVLDLPVDHSLMTKMPHQETGLLVKPPGVNTLQEWGQMKLRQVGRTDVSTGLRSPPGLCQPDLQPKGRGAMASKLQDVLSSSQGDEAKGNTSRSSPARTTHGPWPRTKQAEEALYQTAALSFNSQFAGTSINVGN